MSSPPFSDIMRVLLKYSLPAQYGWRFVSKFKRRYTYTFHKNIHSTSSNRLFNGNIHWTSINEWIFLLNMSLFVEVEQIFFCWILWIRQPYAKRHELYEWPLTAINVFLLCITPDNFVGQVKTSWNESVIRVLLKNTRIVANFHWSIYREFHGFL